MTMRMTDMAIVLFFDVREFCVISLISFFFPSSFREKKDLHCAEPEDTGHGKLAMNG